MTFTNEELVYIIEKIYKTHSYDETIEVSREDLKTPEGQIKWRERNGISAAIKKGFLIQVVPGTQLIPFTVRINHSVLQVVGRVVSIIR